MNSVIIYVITLVMIILCYSSDIYSDVVHNKPQPKFSNIEGFLQADVVEYDANNEFIKAFGHVKILLDDYVLTTDALLYDIRADQIWAEGNIIITDSKEQMVLADNVLAENRFKNAIISNFIMHFQDNSLLIATLAERLDKYRFTLHSAKFTPCSISCNYEPIWQVTASKTYINQEKYQMSYKHALFKLYGVPIFYTPYFAHPTPKAPPRSGILIPAIKNSKIKIPLYWRAQSNFDITLTPNLGKNYIIYELEQRHLLPNGQYTIDASYGHLPESKNEKGKLSGLKAHRYYLFANGAFRNKEGSNYGFNIKHVSDKAYLKNYYERHEPYLDSNFFLNKISNYNYFAIEALQFQPISESTTNKGILVLPQISSKKSIDFEYIPDTNLTFETNNIIYREENEIDLFRNAFSLTLSQDFLLEGGHLINTTLYNRSDIYRVLLDPNRQHYQNIRRNSQTLGRNIPELRTTWRYPLIGNIRSRNIEQGSKSVFLEPISSLVIGRKPSQRDYKFSFIDNSKYEVSDDNLFIPNRYGGIDFHEFGTRFSYGLRTSIMDEDNKYSIFIGQLFAPNDNKNIKQNLNINNANYVGQLSADLASGFSLFYKFRRDKNMKGIKDEIGADINVKNVNLNLTFVKLSNLRKYYNYHLGENDISISNNNVRQLSAATSYKINENWDIGYNFMIDMSKTNKNQMLYKGLKLSYFKDCIKITARIYDDYTYDSIRGIKKTHGKSFSVGLKVINM